MYIKSSETYPLTLNDDENVIFAEDFFYLGTLVDFLLEDALDIRSRINKAFKEFGVSDFIWKSKEVSLETKVKLFLTMLLNFALWNGET